MSCGVFSYAACMHVEQFVYGNYIFNSVTYKCVFALYTQKLK